MVPHSGVVNRLLWMKKQYQINPLDNILQKTPISFDVSVWELFLPLISGATETIAAPFLHKDAEYLLDLVKRQKISVIHFVPSQLEDFLLKTEGSNFHDCALRLLITSGEALSLDAVKFLLSVLVN